MSATSFAQVSVDAHGKGFFISLEGPAKVPRE